MHYIWTDPNGVDHVVSILEEKPDGSLVIIGPGAMGTRAPGPFVVAADTVTEVLGG